MYLFYLGDVLLPVAPSKLQTKISNKNKTMVLINEGEINLPKTPGLTDLSFECLLPATEYPFARYQSGFQKPSYYLSVLEQLKVQGKAFSFRVLRQLDNGQALDLPLSMMVTLEKYTISEDVKNGLDFTVSIDLKQYREYGTKTFTIQKKETSKPEATVTESRPEKEPEKNYTIKKGDNLWNIARKELGDELRWKDIYELNKDTIEAAARKYGKKSSSNGHWIYPGVVLRLPA